MNEGTGKEVKLQGIRKGYEVSEDQYVVLTQDELEAAASSGSRAVGIEDFANQSEIDPVHFDRTQYLAARSQAAVKPYALLREAMRQAGKVGIASFAMRGGEHLAAIRVGSNGDVTVLETLFFADEIRDPLPEPSLTPISTQGYRHNVHANWKRRTRLPHHGTGVSSGRLAWRRTGE